MKKIKTSDGSIPIVCDLELTRYLGTWYEIGRLSAKQQQGLDHVSATYSLKSNNNIKVYNQGYKNNKKRSITGRAWLRHRKCNGALYVRFFWPFKAEYNVIKLASDYRYAVVMGKSKDSLWILSRSPKMSVKDYQSIIRFLDINQFNTKDITITNQNGGCVSHADYRIYTR